MARFEDYFNLDSEFSDDERLLRDTVRSFVAKEFLPHVADHFEAGTFPLDIIPKLGELGLLGMKYEGYGCAGTSNVDYGLACQELEFGDSGLRSFASVQTSLVIHPIITFGSEAQKKKYIPKLVAGEMIGCFGLTEPDHGSDPGSMVTKAERDGDEFILSGAKMWITNGTVADLAIVWAKLDGEIAGFIVEKGTPGFTAPEMKKKLSLRASVTSELVFDEVRIPAANQLPEAKGLMAPLSCLNEARFGIVWGATGAAIACYQSALEYSLERTQFGKPLAGFQLTQRKLAGMITEITKAQMLSLRLGRMKDKGEAKHWHVSMAKYNNVSSALEIARESRAMHGANGITLEYVPMRHAANLESVVTYEGTHDIHTLVIGHKVTGISAYR
jgi:glutaryl-CoA dehydrogenase